MKRIETVQTAMVQRGLQVHGWVYDVASGYIKPLETGRDEAQQHYEIIDTTDLLE
jgi:carbonic anhydrase